LRMKGFVPEWYRLITQFVQGGSVGIKVNNDIWLYFQTRKELGKEIPYHIYFLTLLRIHWPF
jgi:hypothetical protein